MDKGIWQLCPQCHGQGTTVKPPYVAGDQSRWDANTIGPYKCRICNGAGIISVFIGSPPDRKAMNYESGKCANCGKKKEEHYTYNTNIGALGNDPIWCHSDRGDTTFEDIGLKRIQDNAVELLEKAEELQFAKWRGDNLGFYFEALTAVIIKCKGVIASPDENSAPKGTHEVP